MTAKEAIELLSKLDPELVLYYHDADDGQVKVSDIQQLHYQFNDKPHVQII